MRRHFEGFFMRVITAADLDRYRMTSLIEDCVGATTTRKRLIILGTLVKPAERWGVVKVNPARSLQKPSEPTHKVRVLEHGEWTRLLEIASLAFRPLLRLAVSTGMRLKELTGLRWEDVEFPGGILHVAEDSKAGTRAIPFASEGRAVLEAQREPRKSIGREVGKLPPYVFTTAEGEPVHPRQERNRITKTITATVKAAKIEGASMHALRHTAGSWMVQACVPLYEVQKILGHSTSTTTQKYAHLQPKHLTSAVHALGDAIRAVHPPATQPKASNVNESANAASANLSAASVNVGR